MAFFSARAVDGGALYPPAGGFISNNYPPLSFYVIGAVGRLTGDNVTAGRLVALLALAGAAGGVFWSARRLGTSRAAAVAATLLFALFNLTWFHAYVAMADPQWLGEAVTLAGLSLLLRAGDDPLPLGHAALSALLMVTGGFIKHNLIALPLAAGLWLLLNDRRAFLAWSGVAAVALAAGAAAALQLYGGAAFAGVFGDHRRVLPGQWPDALVYFLPMVPLVAATAWLAGRRWGERRVRLVATFAAVALPLAFLQRLGEGVNVNGYFEALVAVCIGAGAALDGAPLRWRGREWSAAALTVVLAAPLLFGLPYFLGKGALELVRAPARQAAWSQVIATVAATPGPVACEMLSVCYWAGKDFELDFFNYGQDLRAGASPAPLARIIDTGRFGAIVLTRDAAFATGEGRLPQPIPARIEAGYKVTLSAPGETVVMTPRR